LQLGRWRCFVTCHCSAGGGGEYWSMSKLGLLIDIRIATSRWPFLLCFKLGHLVHLSGCDVLAGLFEHAVCSAPCIIGQSVLFLSPHASSQCTHQQPPPLLLRPLIALVVLGTKLRCRCSTIVSVSRGCKQRQSVMRQKIEAVVSFASGEADAWGGWAVFPTRRAFSWDQLMRHLDDYCCSAE